MTAIYTYNLSGYTIIFDKVFYQITDKKHYPLLETLAEKIFLKLFENIRVKKVKLRIEKLDVFKNTSSVGIEIEKSKI